MSDDKIINHIQVVTVVNIQTLRLFHSIVLNLNDAIMAVCSTEFFAFTCKIFCVSLFMLLAVEYFVRGPYKNIVTHTRRVFVRPFVFCPSGIVTKTPYKVQYIVTQTLTCRRKSKRTIIYTTIRIKKTCEQFFTLFYARKKIFVRDKLVIRIRTKTHSCQNIVQFTCLVCIHISVEVCASAYHS